MDWAYVGLLSGVLNMLVGMVLETTNLKSFVIFKVLPFFAGLACIIDALRQLNWI